jgi:hypothetical protein
MLPDATECSLTIPFCDDEKTEDEEEKVKEVMGEEDDSSMRVRTRVPLLMSISKIEPALVPTATRLDDEDETSFFDFFRTGSSEGNAMQVWAVCF